VSALPCNWSVMLACSRSAARRATKGRAEIWAEDVAQDVLVQAWLAHEKGFGVGPEQYRYHASNAVRRYVGDDRWNGRAAEHVDLRSLERHQANARHELGPIALHRLQALWPTLTPSQQAAVFALCTGGKGSGVEAAEEFGVTRHAVVKAQATALELLNMPTAEAVAGGALRQRIASTKAQRRAAP
jgi:DNA-directed RNA polymerase specialized sigma24 family protein